MKGIILRIFTFLAILFFIDSILTGFEIETIGAYLLFALLLALTNVTLVPVIKFFTLPINTVTFGLFNFVIACVYIYFFNFIIPGFVVTDGSLGPFVTTNIDVPEIKMSFWAIIIFSSLMITFLNNVVSWTVDEN